MKRTIGLMLLLVAMFAVSSQASLVAYYKLNDAVGSGQAADSSGNGHNAGIWLNSNTYPGGSLFTGTSAYFNPAGGNQTYMFFSAPALTNTAFSWSMWVKTTDTSATLLQRGGGTGWQDGYKCLSAQPTGSSFGECGQDNTTSSGIINDGQWHNLAVTYDNAGDGTIRIYTDGVQTGEKGMTLNNQPENASWQFFIGLGAGGWYCGEMKEVRIYDELLSAAQVNALVPEPATMSLLGLGMLLGMRRRKA